MEITAGFNWILGVVLLGSTQLNSYYAKPAVIVLGIGLISESPFPLRHSGGERTDPGVIIFGLLGVWSLLEGFYLKKIFTRIMFKPRKV